MGSKETRDKKGEGLVPGSSLYCDSRAGQKKVLKKEARGHGGVGRQDKRLFEKWGSELATDNVSENEGKYDYTDGASGVASIFNKKEKGREDGEE